MSKQKQKKKQTEELKSAEKKYFFGKDFDVDETKYSWKTVLLVLIAAYIFSVGVRYIWVYHFSGNTQFKWESSFTPTATDSFYFGSIVQKGLGEKHKFNMLVPDMFPPKNNQMICFFTYVMVKVFSFNINSVMFYMPAFMSSLVVIPIFFIGILYGSIIWAFSASIITGIAWSFYNRTMMGYYDTDMFSVLIPAIILYHFLAGSKEEKLSHIVFASLWTYSYPFFYGSGTPIAQAMSLAFIGYQILLKKRDEFSLKAILQDEFTWNSILILSCGLVSIKYIPHITAGNFPMTWIFRFAIIILAYFGLKKFKLKLKYIIPISIALFLIFLFVSGPFNLVLGKAQGYLSRGVKTEMKGLNFFSVIGTIKEARAIPASLVAKRVSGSLIAAFIAIIGYIILVIKKREFLLALPLIGITIFSLKGGLRFTIYGCGIAAISSVYIILLLSKYIFNAKIPRYILSALVILGILIPNITHANKKKVSVIYTNDIIRVFNKLGKISKEGDYVLSWWDYGSGIWYYGGRNTLTSPAHQTNDLFTMSDILLNTSQRRSANLSRLSVEKFIELRTNWQKSEKYKFASSIEYILKNKTNQQVNPNKLLSELESNNYKLPEKTVDVFLYMPFHMITIIPNIYKFSNIDLTTGNRKIRPVYDLIRSFGVNRNDPNWIVLSRGRLRFHKTQYELKNFRGVKIPIKSFTKLGFDRERKLKVETTILDESAKFHVVFHNSYRFFMILNDEMYNSAFIQMFLFENYDSDLFELVISHPKAKVYKLKI
ncbi:STT3 domain-containing protein [Spirochaetota bacterium]